MRNEECGMWNVECGMRNVECGMWNVECGMWNVDLGVEGLGTKGKAKNFAKATLDRRKRYYSLSKRFGSFF
jgi:hypothetical protein